jgi:hypothetical protein
VGARLPLSSAVKNTSLVCGRNNTLIRGINSDDARWITGQVIIAAGGQRM